MHASVQVQRRTREVRLPADLRVQTRVARTQASCVTVRLDLHLKAKVIRDLRQLATDRHPHTPVVCAFPHTDRLACAVPSLRSHRSTPCSAVEPYTQHERSTTGGHKSNISPARLRARGGKRRITHREYMHRCAHDDLEKLIFARLGIHPRIVSPRKTHREAQCVGYLDGAISASTSWVEQIAISWEMQLCTEGPRTRPQQLGCHFRWVSTQGPEGGERRTLISNWVV